jgi:predicted DNA-binding transcriptional regulator YafY
MKPWIRQWGHDCEVLSPSDLRREIGQEMKAAGALYDFPATFV